MIELGEVTELVYYDVVGEMRWQVRNFVIKVEVAFA